MWTAGAQPFKWVTWANPLLVFMRIEFIRSKVSTFPPMYSGSLSDMDTFSLKRDRGFHLPSKNTPECSRHWHPGCAVCTLTKVWFTPSGELQRATEATWQSSVCLFTRYQPLSQSLNSNKFIIMINIKYWYEWRYIYIYIYIYILLDIDHWKIWRYHISQVFCAF